jgi:hypothetical protein
MPLFATDWFAYDFLTSEAFVKVINALEGLLFLVIADPGKAAAILERMPATIPGELQLAHEPGSHNSVAKSSGPAE